MSLYRRPVAWLAAAGLAVTTMVAGVGPADAADHLDAPGLTSPDGVTALDINDVYAFEGRPGYTTLAMTVSPQATASSDFATRAAYSIRLDLNGDAREDRTYHIRALLPIRGEQLMAVQEATGKQARSSRPRGDFIAAGLTNRSIDLGDGGTLFAGLRSDPFFFDLSGFLGTVEGQGEDALGDDPTDFFTDLNTLAVVIELPDSALNDGDQIGVWGTTSRRYQGRWQQVDRMGRPAINTVVNSSGPIVGAPSEAKNLFNAGKPARDGDFRQAVIDALQAYSSLDSEGPYSNEQAGALADVLLPDLLTYDKSSELPAPLNGRRLEDDVIDVELRIVTGGDPLGLFDDRDADGGVNGDGVGPHDDYLDQFPYLGHPNS
jgi:hypothetical protein